MFFNRTFFRSKFFSTKIFPDLFRSKNFPGFQKSYLEQRAFTLTVWKIKTTSRLKKYPVYLCLSHSPWKVSPTSFWDSSGRQSGVQRKFPPFLKDVAAFEWIVLQAEMIFLIQVFLCFKVCTSTLRKKLSRAIRKRLARLFLSTNYFREKNWPKPYPTYLERVT